MGMEAENEGCGLDSAVEANEVSYGELASPFSR